MRFRILSLVGANLGSQILAVVGEKIGFQTLSNWATVVDGAGSYRSCESRVRFSSFSQAVNINFFMGFGISFA